MSNQVFNTSNGFEIHCFPIIITLGKSAQIDIMVLGLSQPTKKTFVLEGDEYLAWGTDDTYILNYICNQEKYLGTPNPIVKTTI